MEAPEHRRLEEAALSAWPALQQILYDGWLLRFAGGFTKRANSVNALYPSTVDLDLKIARCEHAYTERNLPVIFRVTPTSKPNGLDAHLEQRGYEIIDRTLIMAGSLNLQAEESISTSVIRSASLLEWLDAYDRLRAPAVEQLALLRGIVTKIPTSLCPVLGFQRGNLVGYGLGVLDSELIGILGLYVAPAVRRSGVGETMLLTILQWARMRGAKQGYLQVEADNAPAIKLYRGIGWSESYPYWYRVQGNH
ncbi:GNAT family N-acetyltransferase [Candidatus Bipolaricaulota bacterium]